MASGAGEKPPVLACGHSIACGPVRRRPIVETFELV
jgi:hypothetical protein